MATTVAVLLTPINYPDRMLEYPVPVLSRKHEILFGSPPRRIRGKDFSYETET